jgi:trehalose/maltose hydrolase-like predicted phosphorylase
VCSLCREFTDDEQDEIAGFNDIADQMYILFDDDLQFHPQFEGFDHISKFCRLVQNPFPTCDSTDSTIKQSDVVLLGYPLMMEMTPDIRKNDLTIYEEVRHSNPVLVKFAKIPYHK